MFTTLEILKLGVYAYAVSKWQSGERNPTAEAYPGIHFKRSANLPGASPTILPNLPKNCLELKQGSQEALCRAEISLTSRF